MRRRSRGFTVIEASLALAALGALVTLLVVYFRDLYVYPQAFLVADQVRQIERAAYEYRRDQGLATSSLASVAWPGNTSDLVTGGYVASGTLVGPGGDAIFVRMSNRGYDSLTGERKDALFEVAVPLNGVSEEDSVQLARRLGGWRVNYEVHNGVNHLIYRSVLHARTRQYGEIFNHDEYVSAENASLVAPAELAGHDFREVLSVHSIGNLVAQGQVGLGGLDVVEIDTIQLAETVQSDGKSNPALVSWPAGPNPPPSSFESYTGLVNNTQVDNIVNARQERWSPFSKVIIENELKIEHGLNVAFRNVTYSAYNDITDFVSSDKRLKTNIAAMNSNDAAKVVRDVTALSYQLRTEPATRFGFDTRDFEDFEGVVDAQGGYRALDYARIPVILWAAARDQMSSLNAATKKKDIVERLLNDAEQRVASRLSALTEVQREFMLREGVDIARFTPEKSDPSH